MGICICKKNKSVPLDERDTASFTEEGQIRIIELFIGALPLSYPHTKMRRRDSNPSTPASAHDVNPISYLPNVLWR